jgi:hypothetical protein
MYEIRQNTTNGHVQNYKLQVMVTNKLKYWTLLVVLCTKRFWARNAYTPPFVRKRRRRTLSLSFRCRKQINIHVDESLQIQTSYLINYILLITSEIFKNRVHKHPGFLIVVERMVMDPTYQAIGIPHMFAQPTQGPRRLFKLWYLTYSWSYG